MSSLLEAIPWHLLEDVALNLDYPNVCNLMQTSKTCYSILSANHFWRRYVLANTSLTESKPDEDYRLLYKIVFSERYKAAAVHMNVVWLNDQYLKRKKKKDSFVGEIVELSNVCWLDLRKTFTGVYPGQYHVIWNMKLKSPHVSNQSIFGVEWEGKTQEIKWEFDDWQNQERQCRGFCDYKIATITVTKHADVLVYLYNHSGSWKSGIFWDYVQLKPAMVDIKKRDNVLASVHSPHERYKRAVAYMEVVRLDEEHLVKRQNRGSFSGEIVVLRSVSWLDIKTTFGNVEPAKYDVIWRMKLNEAHVPDRTMFSVSCDDASDQVVWFTGDWTHQASQSDGWQEYHLGSITLTRPLDVTVHMYNHSSELKHGVKWDYVHMRPAVE